MWAKSIQSCPIPCNPMDHIRLLCPWDSPGKNTGVDYQSLLQGSKLLLLHWQVGSLPLAPSGKPQWLHRADKI